MNDRKTKLIASAVVMVMFLLGSLSVARAHFGMIIPSDDMVTQSDDRSLTLDIKFTHPMEGHYMNMAKPAKFGVVIQGKNTDLLNTLREKKVKGFSTWEAKYKIRRPGDHTFYVVPEPYWEPAEDCFIIHYTKVI
ncbi:MAG: DUF4198 domain-containing protein, partial [Pseudomonadota bacterium]